MNGNSLSFVINLTLKDVWWDVHFLRCSCVLRSCDLFQACLRRWFTLIGCFLVMLSPFWVSKTLIIHWISENLWDVMMTNDQDTRTFITVVYEWNCEQTINALQLWNIRICNREMQVTHSVRMPINPINSLIINSQNKWTFTGPAKPTWYYCIHAKSLCDEVLNLYDGYDSSQNLDLSI